MEKIVIGVLAGLVWGGLIACLNSLIMKYFIKTNEGKNIAAANLIRSGMDIAALAAVFLLRKLLPFSYEAMLIATAVGMSVLTIIFTFSLSKSMRG